MRCTYCGKKIHWWNRVARYTGLCTKCFKKGVAENNLPDLPSEF